jgi:lipopolysaccharide export system protein LptA
MDSIEKYPLSWDYALMRRFGPLIVLAILFIVGRVGITYIARLKQLASAAPAKPNRLPDGTQGAAQDWMYTKTQDGKKIISIKAKGFEQIEGKIKLTGVELHIFDKYGKKYDQVKSASAEFDEKGNELYSDGDVDITMAVPADKPENEPPSGKLMDIKSSGVHFDSKTGKANTDREATFAFDRGDGKCIGAEYDPNTRELHMKSAVVLNWHGTDPSTKPMHIETSDLVYKERDGKVFLTPWSKLIRDTMIMNAGPATVSLNKGQIQLVETTAAQGTDRQPKRKLDYGADNLRIEFDNDNQVRKIIGTQNARLVSSADTGVTRLTTDRVDMDFDVTTKDSILKTAVATGHSVAESLPIAKTGDPPEARVLKSEVINTKMRDNGQEIESVETPGAGTLEFIPATPTQSHRWMNGDHIWMTYGPDNQIQTFRSVNVWTKTEKPKPPNAKEKPAPAQTWSKDMLVSFQPHSSDIDKLEQNHDFRYEEGDRKAKADRALLDQRKNLIDLIGGARVWDSTGSADADHIILDQKSGDFMAEGNVRSVRMPDKKSGDSPGMLSEDEPLHGRAKKMSSTDNNLNIHYEGDVVLWQGANRLTADVVEIDRDDNNLNAHGHVVSQLMDKKDAKDKKDDKNEKAAADVKKPGGPIFSIVHAPELIYNDDDRIAVYKGGVLLDRGDTKVKSRELKAYLRDNQDDSSLDHAFADGQVQITSTAVDRTRTGTSEHAEYYVDEDKVILEGGQPKFVDTLRGVTQGKQLIWYSKDDRLLVNGAVGQPAQSHLRRKHN